MAFKKFNVIAPSVDIHGGEIELTEAQVKFRQGNLALIKGNRYAVQQPIQFKKGESIGLDEASLAKGMERFLAVVPEPAVLAKSPKA